ncbi:serine/threonine-protein kinase [Oceanobacillus sp. CFH 90083]|uniref:serine/threonine protein kinase n=1 Tax=Oceanobacillus sp. CFH 90083 TaxID=2592336 RepID=UPI00128D3BE6|nr:serine/threonine-protein kinase [Oceanobacillus sp. CFH 90083]
MWKKHEMVQHKYEMIDYAAEGGTSLLYEVKLTHGEHALLKVVKSPDTLLNNQIDNEAAILATVKHDRIPKLYDKLTVNQYYKAVVIEKLEAVDLSEIVEKGKKFTWEEILDIAKQLADIIQAFHQNKPAIVIRDIKPSNILLAEDRQVYLVDFGISATVEQAGQVNALGTIGYAAPEQFENGVVDLRSDLFSLGAVLFYLVSNGKNIYASDHEIILRNRLPKTFANIVIKLTATNPDKRFTSIEKVISAFAKVNRPYRERMKELIHSRNR